MCTNKKHNKIKQKNKKSNNIMHFRFCPTCAILYCAIHSVPPKKKKQNAFCSVNFLRSHKISLPKKTKTLKMLQNAQASHPNKKQQTKTRQKKQKLHNSLAPKNYFTKTQPQIAISIIPFQNKKRKARKNSASSKNLQQTKKQHKHIQNNNNNNNNNKNHKMIKSYSMHICIYIYCEKKNVRKKLNTDARF